MTAMESLILGVVQGLSEFLPVSSSAHLVILQDFLGMHGADRLEQLLFFDVCLHAATLIAVVLYFRETAASYLRTPKVLLYILVATIPTGVIGLLIEKHMSAVFESALFSGCMLLVTGAVLFAVEISWEHAAPATGIPIQRLGWLRSVMVGVAQGIAVLPGISRSGATVSTLMALRVSRADAAQFTFLLSVPAIAGATLLKVREAVSANDLFAPVMLWGMVGAFLAGLAALYFFTALFRVGRLRYFSWYCWVLGAAVIARHLLRAG